MANLEEIIQHLTELSSWPWREGERLETGCTILDAHGGEVGAAHDKQDADFIIASPQLVEGLLYEVKKLRKQLNQKQSVQNLFARERRLT